ncbi:hypothetical protein NLJ89_g9876 [Agrocybe chaxingu]|uniref:Uncharacterized protein n=1 Tax=Agrocybe chaxingu TaxID=84603 RepID=A0A9W8MT49_9AGAR|nr:hypothetical protein NLJ89_g9876 [Agrocybe chaxingu]
MPALATFVVPWLVRLSPLSSPLSPSARSRIWRTTSSMLANNLTQLHKPPWSLPPLNIARPEKNTPPDFTTNPPTLRNSVFCQQAPRNAELVGLVQAQDPANDPDLFFDPALRATVTRGSQANTAPFAG